MNYRIVSAFLGVAAFFFGASTVFCLPWALESFGGNWACEAKGVFGLAATAATCFVVGLVFYRLGRGADPERLFRKEAIAVVVSSWILAVVLGALPYLFAGVERSPGVPATVADALFESASGLTTTGATVFGELENPKSLPRTILFWRALTHFLGGLGVVCFFVALLGQGARGKAVMKLEHSVAAGSVPITKIREFAFHLLAIYVGLVVLCAIALLLCGLSFFDAISHSFSAVANGGFSAYNASVGRFSGDPKYNGAAIEIVLIVFMLLASTNFWLLYWVVRGKFGKLFRDSEWRTFVACLVVAILTTFATGVFQRDFDRRGTSDEPVVLARDGDDEKVEEDEDDAAERARRAKFDEELPWPTALRTAAFNVVSLATGAGFATDEYERWNATSLAALLALMFIGGCTGSAAGGAKVARIVVAAKTLARIPEGAHSPNVVRTIRLDGEVVDKETIIGVFVFLASLIVLIVATTFLTLLIEPNALWNARGESQVDKLVDLASASLASYSNVGPALGVFGARGNFGDLTSATKIVFACAMLIGRLEVWTVLAFFSPSFWRAR